MQQARIAWILSAALSAALLMVGAANAASAATAQPSPTSCSREELVYLGSDASELRALRFDACAGRLTALGVVAELPKPRWVIAHPRLPLLYVANDGGVEGGKAEGGKADGGKADGAGADGHAASAGRVSAFAIEPQSGALRPLNEAEAGGGGSTHLSLDGAAQTLLVANFRTGSVASIAVEADGRLGARLSGLKAAGSGPHRRQASAHAHGIVLDPSEQFVLVADLGADRVFVHRFDPARRVLSAVEGQAFVAPPGSGPRRAVFGPSGRFVYVLNELSAELMVLRWDAPRLTQVQTLALSSPAFQGVKSASEIAVSRDGRFVYVADRGEGALLVYGVDAASGELTLLQRLSSGGEAPWAFALHPSGRWLLVANYRSNRVQLFGVDAASGRLSDSGHGLASPAPVSVLFVN